MSKQVLTDNRQPPAQEREATAAERPSGIEDSYRIELFRKAIHFSSLAIPVLYSSVSRTLALSVLVPLTTVFILLDIARYRLAGMREFFTKIFGPLLRKREQKRLNGATYVLIAATLCILVFPKIIAITSFAVLIISDMTSALVGRRLGRHRFLGKSLEGSMAFFLSAVAVIAFTPKVASAPMEYAIGISAAAVGTLVEGLSTGLDDNITVPLSVGAALWAGYLLFAPGLDLGGFRG